MVNNSLVYFICIKGNVLYDRTNIFGSGKNFSQLFLKLWASTIIFKAWHFHFIVLFDKRLAFQFKWIVLN